MHASAFVLLTFAAAAVWLFIGCPCGAADGLGRGLGDEIDWKALDEGLLEAKEKHKPLMLIMHKSWCGACKAFKPHFAASKEIQELSTKFVMVNTQDDDEPKDPKYTPDGGYIPRILFLDPTGQVQTDIYNKGGNANYKYFYSSAEAVLESMREALAGLSSGEKEL